MKRFVCFVAVSLLLLVSALVIRSLMQRQYVENVVGTVIAKRVAIEMTGRYRVNNCYLVGVRPEDTARFKTFAQKVDMVTFETTNIGDRICFKRLPKNAIGDESWTIVDENMFCGFIVLFLVTGTGFLIILVMYIVDFCEWCINKISDAVKSRKNSNAQGL